MCFVEEDHRHLLGRLGRLFLMDLRIDDFPLLALVFTEAPFMLGFWWGSVDAGGIRRVRRMSVNGLVVFLILEVFLRRVEFPIFQ